MFFDSNSIKIPKKIDSPIVQSVLEIHFESDISRMDLYAFLKSKIIKLDFIDKNIDKLPIFQIPEDVVKENDFMKRQPVFSVKSLDEKYFFAIGTNVAIFFVNGTYEGWNEWQNFFEPLFKELDKENFIKSISSISNKVIDEIDDEQIYQNLNCSFFMTGRNLFESDKFNVKNNFTINDLDCSLNIIHNEEKKLILDVVCISNKIVNSSEFFKNPNSYLENPHETNKKIFFGLVSEEYVRDNFKPVF